MSELSDPLETELSAIRPREVSPGLRGRIAERLADPPRARRGTWRLALVGGLAAACLAAVLLRWGGGHGGGAGPTPVVVRPEPAPPDPVKAEVEDVEPTLLAYERALARSPDDLDALLSRRAAATPGSHPEPARFGAFSRSDAMLRTLLGEH